jgi:hypothetical protein
MKQLFLGIILALQCGVSSAFSYTLELPEAELQVKADAMMPLEKKKFFVTTILTNPVIDLLASTNEIGLTTDVSVKAPGNIAGSGKVSFRGSLRYDNDSGSFFFENLNVDSLIVENVSPESLPKIKKMLEYVARKFLAVKPVYKFKDDNLKHKLAKSVLKSIRVDSGILFVELGLF